MLRNRETIPPALKTIRSSSVGVGDPVLSVYVPGHETAAWNDQERRKQWQKARPDRTGVFGGVQKTPVRSGWDRSGPGGLTCENLTAQKSILVPYHVLGFSTTFSPRDTGPCSC
jgi:hypothetical protein